jgi:hypothetical protein
VKKKREKEKEIEIEIEREQYGSPSITWRSKSMDLGFANQTSV